MIRKIILLITVALILSFSFSSIVRADEAVIKKNTYVVLMNAERATAIGEGPDAVSLHKWEHAESSVVAATEDEAKQLGAEATLKRFPLKDGWLNQSSNVLCLNTPNAQEK